MSDAEIAVATLSHVDASIRRRVRLIALLEGARQAGIDPLPSDRLHTVAYLANVLSPVWDMPTADGAVLKRRGGPFFPELQADLDRLVGMGVVFVGDLRHRRLDNDRYRLDGSYRLNDVLAGPILSFIQTLPDEMQALRFVSELTLALSGLTDEQIDRAVSEDATYANPSVGLDNVIEFDGFTHANYSVAAAEKVGSYVKTHAEVGPGEKVHLYIQHLRRRLQGAR